MAGSRRGRSVGAAGSACRRTVDRWLTTVTPTSRVARTSAVVVESPIFTAAASSFVKYSPIAFRTANLLKRTQHQELRVGLVQFLTNESESLDSPDLV